MRVVGALRDKLQLLKQTEQKDGGAKQARLLLMADATYGSCCVDEVGASHIDAECVVHYGHTCLIPTSTVPAFFVLGKASMDAAPQSLMKVCRITHQAGKRCQHCSW
ncbi:2-(3-amino-3-carboxypropyl)histidine synthase subunit 2, partial [Linum grandiflorum]